MDKKKKHTDSDELALVKAAAWAWHQHSSSTKNKRTPPPEFPLAKPRRLSSSHRPSRYRLESLSKSNPTASPPAHLKSGNIEPITLLDMYEIERITRELKRLMTASERREKVVQGKVPVRKRAGGGCLLGRHAVMICGSRGTEVETEALVGRRRERSTEII